MEEDMKIEFGRKEDVRVVKDILEKIGDPRTVMMAPELGNSNDKKRSNKLRIYSYGGRVLDLSTTTRAKNDILSNKGYGVYNTEGIPNGNIPYEILNEQNLRGMISIAKKRATGESARGTKKGKAYLERSVETRLIKRNREDICGSGIIIDMEFTSPASWMGNQATCKETSKRGKPDLVVYDRDTESFGLIEFKYQNNSCNNMEKHIADFYNIIHGGYAEDLIKEFWRKMRYLEAYGIIDEVKEFKIQNAVKNQIWSAFLFVGGDECKSRELFASTKVDEKIKNEVGFLYVPNLETKIDYSRRSFLPNLVE